MIKEKILKKENKVVVLTIALLGLFILVGTSFALWNLTLRQTNANQINTSCFKIDFTEKDDINLENTYPLSNEEASNLSPYTFTITNICDTTATYQVNLEELEVERKKLSSEYIKLSLNDKTGNLPTFEEVTKTLANATTSHKLTTGVLKSKEEKIFELRLWLRDDAPATSDVMNASFLSKITVITVYKKNIPEVSSLAYENLDTIKVDVNTISNPDNEILNYYYQLDNNEKVKSNTGTHTFPNLQDGTYKVKVRVENTNGIVLFEKEESVTVAYEHVYISSTGNDTTGNGSPDSPYATLQRAYNKVKSGGEMILLSDITATSTTNMNTTNKEVTLKSNGENIYSVTKASSFTTQILDITNSNTVTTTNITFDGNNVVSSAALLECKNSTLNLNTGTTIQNNNNRGRYYDEDELGGTGAVGGGIFALYTTLNINGATITKNKTTAQTGNWSSGAGIACGHGTLNLYSGTISYNENAGSILNQLGGGIVFSNGTLNMFGGSISNNKTPKFGGGIMISSIDTDTVMTMTGGSITYNTVTGNSEGNHGGGIFVEKGGSTSASATVYLRAGIISNNTALYGANTYENNGAQIIDQR